MGTSVLLGCFGRRRSSQDEQTVAVASGRPRRKEHPALKPTDLGGGGRTSATPACSANPAGNVGCDTKSHQHKKQQHQQKHLQSLAGAATSPVGYCEHSVTVTASETSRLPVSDECTRDSLEPAERRLISASAEQAGVGQLLLLARRDSGRSETASGTLDRARQVTSAPCPACCSDTAPSADLHLRGQPRATVNRQESARFSLPYDNQQCGHEETLEVVLEPWKVDLGVGFTLCDWFCNSCCSQPDDNYSQPATVHQTHQPAFATVEPDSYAARCGVIFVGDRLLSINGQSTKNKAAPDVAVMISQHFSKGCTLEIAFYVQDLFAVEQGVYSVKLPKIRGSGLGITVAPLSDIGDGSGLTVVDVKKGSAAYRQGCIRSGDRLLSANDKALNCCDADDGILSSIHDAEGPISLRLLRVPFQTVTSRHITYTVQLEDSRWSELGVTLDGAQDGGSPIIVSDIRPGGVAAHSGLLHVGDRILAVNGVSIVGCRPSQAAQLLKLESKSIALQVQHTISSAGYDWISKVATETEADCCCSSSSSDSSNSDSSSTVTAAGGASTSTGGASTSTGCMPQCTAANAHGGFGDLSVLGDRSRRKGTTTNRPVHHRAPSFGHRRSEAAGDYTQRLELNLRCADDEHGFGFSLADNSSYCKDDGDVGDCCDNHKCFKDRHESSGCYIIAVQPGGAAERADLRPYDRLLEVDGTAVESLTYDDVVRRVQAASAVTGGRRIVLQIGRCCRTRSSRATLDEAEPAASNRLTCDDSSSLRSSEPALDAAPRSRR